MVRLTPIGLWRIYVAVAIGVVAIAWTLALTQADPGEGVSTRWRAAYLPATLLTLLLAATGLFTRSASRRLQISLRALRKEIRRSRTVFESMREGVLLLDINGRIEFINSAARTWLPEARGRRFAPVIARNGFVLTREDGSALDDPDPIRQFCLRRGADLDAIWLTRSEAPDSPWLELSVRILRDDGGTVTGATLTITDRSEAHERLTESALSASILANMHDAVLIADAHGIVVDVNPAFTRLTGYTRDEIVGRSADILRSVQYDSAFHTAFWQQMERDGHWSGRFWNRRKSGEEYCAWQIVTLIRDLRQHTVRIIVVSRDITEQELRESELWQRANFDPLTGLANRTRFNDRFEQALTHANRHGESLALCYLDLDRFKQVNDSLGHAAGDALLREVAQRMQAVLREDDLLARLGGDEFALLLCRTRDVRDIGHVARKIIDTLARPFDLAEGQAQIGVSIGVARFPADGGSARMLATAADSALYRVKAGGRNGWRLASEDGGPPAAAY
ncbi:MAG: diguanylate cyclase [Rhodocyclaceae bacterium]|nr:diguanylate cyclase [Rhodocyclaceae bacterium]